MRNGRLYLVTGLLAVLSSMPVMAQSTAKKPLPDHAGRIQIALLLDTSNSMDGLINQAKSQLWNIVNELGAARCRCSAHAPQTPVLEVALYEYGNDNLSAGEGYLRMVLPFTTDLDKLSEQLFKLKTNGGSEYCGQVINAAVEGLAWSNSEKDLKCIYIAGNEPFTQGSLDYHLACTRAVEKNILVNPIFCGPRQTGIATQWEQAAILTAGRYLNIDQNRHLVYHKAPQDDRIAALNRKLNSTFIPFGDDGHKSAARQMQQDQLAGQLSQEVLVKRAVAKSSAHYRNEKWDLVDAVRRGIVDLKKMDAKDLPASMQAMDPAQRGRYVEQQRKARQAIMLEIQKLNRERQAYLAKQAKSSKAPDTLDAVMIQTVRDQAQAKGFQFVEEAP